MELIVSPGEQQILETENHVGASSSTDGYSIVCVLQETFVEMLKIPRYPGSEP